MTTAVRTIQRTEQTGGTRRILRGLAGALGDLHERVVAWSATYCVDGSSQADDQPLAQRLDAALRWQSDHRRTV